MEQNTVDDQSLSDSSSENMEGAKASECGSVGASRSAVMEELLSRARKDCEEEREQDCEEEKQGVAAGGVGSTGGIDRLLQQHRKEIMFELRRLQNGDRPVTGQENRKNVEDFFLRSTKPEAAREAAANQRPEEVLVEVQGLVERRPVSSLLNSLNFRRHLENTIRGSFAGINAPRPPPRPAAREAGLHAPEVRSQMATPQPSPIARPENVSASFRPSNTSLEEGERVLQTPPAPPALPLVTPLPPIQPAERAESWLRQQSHPTPGTPSATLWDNMEQVQRDNLISEISELVQQQLVTSTLTGDFRNTLELTMNNHLATTGTDGQRVRQVINSLPRFPAHLRNNFSDLGIPSGPNAHLGGNHDDLSDTVSVISATAAITVPHSQSTAVMTREIGSLKSQMEELKAMMRLSFDLQLDIQRSIRQEVAAAISAASASAPAEKGAHCSAALSSKPADCSMCVICLERSADTVLYKCGHLCMCHTCGMTLRQHNGNCPVCRAPIVDIIRAYTVGHTD